MKMSDKVHLHFAKFLFKKQNRRGNWSHLSKVEQGGWMDHADICLRNVEDAGLTVVVPDCVKLQPELDLAPRRGPVVAVSGGHVVFEQPSEMYLTREQSLDYIAQIAGAVNELPYDGTGVIYIGKISAA